MGMTHSARHRKRGAALLHGGAGPEAADALSQLGTPQARLACLVMWRTELRISEALAL